MKKKIEIGDRVVVYNRYLFALPVAGVVTEITPHDGALRILFDENAHGRAHERCSGKWFFPQECRRLKPSNRRNFWVVMGSGSIPKLFLSRQEAVSFAKETIYEIIRVREFLENVKPKGVL